MVDMQKNKKKTRGRQMSLLGLFSYQLLCVRMNEWVDEFQFLGCFDIFALQSICDIYVIML